MNIKKKFVIVSINYSIFYFVVFIPFTLNLNADSLKIETDYRLTGLSYPNLDFDLGTSTDSISYYTQRLRFAVQGNLYKNIEFCTRLQALGVVGSTTSMASIIESPNSFSITNWQKQYPYPNTMFNPFLENIYIKATGINSYPVDLTIGRQPIEYGTGLILSDNGAGMDAIKLSISYPESLYTEIFTAQISQNIYYAKYFDVRGVITRYPLKGQTIGLGYFEERNLTGTDYVQGINSIGTHSKIKQFYELSLYNSGKWGNYSVEYAMQKGGASLLDNTNVEFDGRGFVAQGRLINERARIGKVAGYAILAAATGDAGKGAFDDLHDTDESFTPDFTRRYDGLSRNGWGQYFASSIYDSYFDIPELQASHTPNYQGFGVFGFGADITPLAGWTFGVSGYYYSATEAYDENSPKVTGGAVSSSSSGLETLLGMFIKGSFDAARYNLGAELDLSATYEYSKYLGFKFAYARYTPPSFAYVWPKNNTSEMFLFETNIKF